MSIWILLASFVVPPFICSLFFRWYNKTSVFCGFFSLLTILFLAMIVLGKASASQSQWLAIPSLILIITGVLLISFGLYLLILMLLLNFRTMRKKERHSWANSLSLLFAIVLIIVGIIIPIFLQEDTPLVLVYIGQVVTLMMFFYFLHLSSFLMTLFLCNLVSPRYKQDYIIILGAGIRPDGTPTPLLANRINRAVQFYQKQKKHRNPPTLICSGGKGDDESQSEAKSMADYAITLGVPAHDLRLEEHSTNTEENMLFSKKIMEQESQGNSFRSIFSTSNYHLLRAGAYARKIGLSPNGIGAKTAWYYLPNAVLREYIAYVWLHRKIHLLILLLIILCGIGIVFFNQNPECFWGIF